MPGAYPHARPRQMLPAGARTQPEPPACPAKSRPRRRYAAGRIRSPKPSFISRRAAARA